MQWIKSVLDGLLRLRNRHFFAIDVVSLLFSPLVASGLIIGTFRFGAAELELLLITGMWFLVVKVGVFAASNLYSRFWKYASVDELAQIICAVVASSLICAVLLGIGDTFLLIEGSELPPSLVVIDGLITLAAVGASRYSVRLTQRIAERMWNGERASRALIVGASESGVRIAREMQANPDLGLYPVAFVDDDEEKQGSRISGMEVLGDRYDIPSLVDRMGIEEIVLAMPDAPGTEIREIVQICDERDVKTRTIPGFSYLLNGEVEDGSVREIRIEDLLRRDVASLDVKNIADYIHGRRIMITGAGGSIGSELVRQIVGFEPEKLFLLGRGENSVYQLYKELQEENMSAPLELIVADVRNHDRIDYLFEKCKPDVVFHAAAHKHVPLMEKNPPEAIENNVFGTLNVAKCARRSGVHHFVNISTDKAVNPTSIMGASKRLAEFAVNYVAEQASAHQHFVSVRFGNVLGSRGSVVPVFKKQIAEGGPVTVTHPEMKRFFMTIPEAAQLVLQAGAVGENGNVYVLDMGEPVKIVDLAKDLIELSGLEPGEDIEIEFVGMRPGEKLKEDLFAEDEVPSRTQQDNLLVATNGGLKKSELAEYMTAIFSEQNARDEVENILALIDQLISTYEPSEEVREYMHARIANDIGLRRGESLHTRRNGVSK